MEEQTKHTFPSRGMDLWRHSSVLGNTDSWERVTCTGLRGLAQNPLKFAGTLRWGEPEPKGCQKIIHSLAELAETAQA